jgi:cell division inhibitor SepF
MASFMSKALEYLGLKEFDDDEEFYEEDEFEEPAPRRTRRPAPPEREFEREPRLIAEPVTQVQPSLRIKANPLRPVPLEEQAPAPTTMASPTSLVRPIASAASSINAQPIVHIVTPHQFENAQEVAHAVKAGKSVIINLVSVDPDLTRRLVDFCAGLTMGIEGKLERVTEKVFLLTPDNVTISNDERTRLRERGFGDL